MKKNRKRLIPIVTTVILLASILTTAFASTIVSAGGKNYGSSPYISLLENKIDIDESQFYDGTTVFKLPSSVKDTDELSLIIQMSEDSLLDAYDSKNWDMSFSEFYSTDEAAAIRDNITKAANEKIALLRDSGISYKTGVSYSTLMSGFEITAMAADFKDICQTLGTDVKVIVGEAYEAAKTEDVTNEVDVYETGIFDSSDFAYQGDGMVVAVLDTGLDYYHTAFSTSNFTSSKLGLTFDDVAAILAGNNMASEGLQSGLTASDVYVSDKVPFAFDYADGDSDVYPIKNDHGTHVAGIIAGKDDTIVGVAPNAQLAIMKIFSETMDTARTSWIIRALEDCVILGVDVINMSIGTACGFSRETDKEQISGVYQDIRDRGISLVVAASNSYNSTYGSEKNGNLGLTSNPDSATIGSPATYEGALAVASINGAETFYILYNGEIIYFTESADRVSEDKDFVKELLGEEQSKTVEFVTIPGAGRKADYTGVDVRGKIALIRRGSTTFEEKANTAEQMGALGVIIYNNVSGDIKMNVGDTQIPVCSISRDDGEMLARAKRGTITVSYSQSAGPFMSDFSSWGPGPDLEIKPEITAHGGSILSSIPGQEYDRISGTSMATPNISGVAALLRQYVISRFFPEYDNYSGDQLTAVNKEITAKVNRILMSTADIALNKNGLPYSVRKQGAGLANLDECALTTAYILTYNRLTGSVMDKSKIELGDDPDKNGVYDLVFTIENFGEHKVSYNLTAYVMTEGVSDNKTSQGETTVSEEAYILDGATVVIKSVEGGEHSGESISVNAGSSAKVTVTVTLGDKDKEYLNSSFENGMYVEGFVMLDATSENTVDLSVPYLGFYGDWTVAPLLDLDYFETNKDELDDSISIEDKTLPDAYATRPVGGINGDYVSFLGSYYYEQKPGSNMISADRKYISLTNSEDGINSLRFIWGGLLRNAATAVVTVTEDSTGEVVYETTDVAIRKSFGDGGPISPSNIDVEFSAIEQNLKNNTKYTVTMKCYLDYGDGGADTNLSNEFTFPLVADFQAPSITDCEFYTEYDRSEKKTRLYAKIAVYDNHYSMGALLGYVGLEEVNGEVGYVFKNFDRYMTQIYSSYNSTSYVIYELTDYIDDIKNNSANKNTFTIACYDYALNNATYEIALPDEFSDLYFEDKEITLSKNEVYDLAPKVHPGEEWSELLEYTSSNQNVVRVVGNQLIAIGRGNALIRATGYDKSGNQKSATMRVTVLDEGDDGFKQYSQPVVQSFELVSFYVNKAYYFLSSEDRNIGETGDERMFSGNYSLEMYPSESITLNCSFVEYFKNSVTVKFESSNESIVKIDSMGTVTAVAEGYSSVTVKLLMNGKNTFYSRTVNIEVKDPYVTTGPSLTNYYGNGGVVEIPETLAITSIGQYAFSNYDYIPKEEGDEISDEVPEKFKVWYLGENTITKVIIPEGVETIGPYAFANLTALKEVVLPSTLKKIDQGAFIGCSSLEKVSGIGNVKFINDSAFAGCKLDGTVTLTNAIAVSDYAFAYNTNLDKVVLSEKTQSVGKYAFAGCKNMTNLAINAGKLKLGEFAFTECSRLTSVSLNAAVIPSGTFYGCKNLASVTIGKDVAVIGEYAFGDTKVESFTVASGNATFKPVTGKSYLTSADGTEILLVAPAITELTVTDTKITAIGNGALSGNTKITKITAPSVKRVRDYAFSECINLSSVQLGALTEIGDYAFYNTDITAIPQNTVSEIGDYSFARTDITSVEIGEGVTVGAYAFEECESLSTVVVHKDAILLRGAFSFNKYGNHYEYGAYTDDLGNHITQDGNKLYSYHYKSPLISLTIGEGVTIGDDAFYGASDLTAVALGSGTRIGDRAFYNAAKLKSIDLSGVLSIGEAAFSGHILNVYYNNTLESNLELKVVTDEDGNYVYSFNSAPLTSVALSSLESIGKEAFAYNKKLTAAMLGDSLTEIADSAFYYCEALSTVNLNKVESIGEYAFSETALSSANLTAAEKIGEYAFTNCTALSAVTLGTGVKTIAEGAFAYCEGLATVGSLSKVEYIGNYAFAYTRINSADLTEAKYIGDLAFIKESVTDFDLTLGKNLTDIGENPFAFCRIEPLYKTVVTDSFNNTDYESKSYTFALGNLIRIIDGSIYKAVNRGLVLVSYLGDGTTVKLADNTVRLSAYAFAGSEVVNVILPYTVSAIGHKAFFECDALKLVNFASYNAPVLEEEYDYYYCLDQNNNPFVYAATDESGNPIIDDNGEPVEIGLDIVKFNMWNVSSLPSNYFFGANFVDYVGKVENKVMMLRPSNGQNYNSFIFTQYFDTVLEGASAADDITLSAITEIQKLPENSSNVTLGHKTLVSAARAAYDKVVSDEQRALIPTSLLNVLKNAEQMIQDLEYLASGDKDDGESENTPSADSEGQGIKTALIVLIVIVSILALAIIALGVFVFIFVMKLKRGEISLSIKSPKADEAIQKSTDTLPIEADTEITVATEYSAKPAAEDEQEPEPELPREPFKKKVFAKPTDYDDITVGYATDDGKLSKRKIALIACAAVAAVAIVVGIVIAIINAGRTYYDGYEKDGYTVSVKFDSNGGTFKGSNSTIVDLYNPEDVGDEGLAILAPDDARRDKNNIMQVTNPGYFLAGWYTERSLIDENNPELGYTYSGKWDFENDRLPIYDNYDYKAEESALTLYAAWVPYYNFEIYTKDEGGNSYLLSTVSALNLTIPEWHDGDVTLSMDNFPKREGYTLVSVEYLDTNIIETTTDNKKTITGKWDEETATLITPTIRLETEWKVGKTYKIYSANDFVKNADLEGYYELYANLDFTGISWPATFSNGKFNGRITAARTRTISGISFESTSRSRIANGLFSQLGENAYIENVRFENITHTIDLGAVAQDATFGLLAGTVADGATFKNVRISGKLVFGDSCATLAGDDSYTVKTVFGSGDATGITKGEITAVKKNGDNTEFDVILDGDEVSIVSGN